MSEKINLQALLRAKANREDMPHNVVPAAAKQAQHIQGNTVVSDKPVRGEVTMDKFIEDIRNLFDEGAQLGIDKKGVLGHVVQTAQVMLQEEKQQGLSVQSSATSTAITTKFTGDSSAADTKSANNASPILPSGLAH